jgi:hypothetical protein
VAVDEAELGDGIHRRRHFDGGTVTAHRSIRRPSGGSTF